MCTDLGERLFPARLFALVYSDFTHVGSQWDCDREHTAEIAVQIRPEGILPIPRLHSDLHL